jgi:hypothetical protein
MSKVLTNLGLMLTMLVGAATFADDPVTIRIYNDDASDIVVSVYDLNAPPAEALVATQRINGFAWIPVSLTAGAAGKGDLRLIARTSDPTFQECAHKEVRGVANDATVYISVDSGCRKPTRSNANVPTN